MHTIRFGSSTNFVLEFVISAEIIAEQKMTYQNNTLNL